MARAALSLPFSGLSGSLGDTIIVQKPDGPQVRRRTPVRKGRTPAQDAARRRMEGVSRAWAVLDEAAFSAWGRYALARAWRNPATGAIVVPKAYCLFCGLAAKARQVDPSRSLERFMPPARPFTGDGIRVVAQASPPANPAFAGTEPRATTEALSFSSDRANAPGIVTELLTQTLVNARRAAYKDKYVSRGFVAFAGAETVEVALEPGAWACAFRFVRPETGEETALVELGVLSL